MTTRSNHIRVPVALAGLVVALVLVSCSDGTGPKTGDPITELPRALTVAEREVIAASNGFGLELVTTAAAADDRPNVILSPLSASMALGMALNGTDAATFDAVRTTLGFADLEQEDINASYRGLIDLLTELDPRVTFRIGNSIWARDTFPFHDAFFDRVVAAFDAVVESRDFDDPATVDAINAWVDEKTEGYIDSIVDALSPADVMLLINAIYFDAEWTLQFDPDDTRTADFYLEEGGTVPVEMMSLDEADVRMAASPDYSAAELPYGGEAFSMVLVLPRYGVTVRELLGEMDAEDWGTLLGGLSEVEGARIELPKFTLTHEAWLNDPLMDMGMEIAFTPAADFTRLSPLGDQLCISYVRQKTFIEVDERGTRAAAATAVAVGLESAPPGFVADRPFVFLIRERLSETILFAGIVGDPTAEDPGPEDPTVLCN